MVKKAQGKNQKSATKVDKPSKKHQKKEVIESASEEEGSYGDEELIADGDMDIEDYGDDADYGSEGAMDDGEDDEPGKSIKVTSMNDDGDDDDEDDEPQDEETKAALKKATEERKKKKKLEQLDKRIKKLTKKQEKDKPIERIAAEIKNKQKRQEIVIRKKGAAKEVRTLERLKKKKVREEQGEDAMPKGITKTIESMRVADDTLIDNAEDEDIKGEQEIDEFASYFKNMTTPKILMTTNRRPKGVNHFYSWLIEHFPFP